MTKKYINEKTFAHETVFKTALKINKPVLPFLMERTDDMNGNERSAFMDDLNRMTGNLQCITPLSRDNTEIPYKIKLKKYLEAIFLNNEQITKVRKGSELLTKTLRDVLHDVKGENNDPRHIYLIGLAYLNGIDVETDPTQALKMISYAAEHGVTKAVGKLAAMYWTGDGVTQDLEAAFCWQKKFADIAENTFKSDPSDDNAVSWVTAVIDSGYYIEKNGLSKELISQYDKALKIVKDLYNRYSPKRLSECVRFIIYSYREPAKNIVKTFPEVKKCCRKITEAQSLLLKIKSSSDEMAELICTYGNSAYKRYDPISDGYDETSAAPEEYAEDIGFYKSGLEYTYQFIKKYPKKAEQILFYPDYFYDSINYNVGDKFLKKAIRTPQRNII